MKPGDKVYYPKRWAGNHEFYECILVELGAPDSKVEIFIGGRLCRILVKTNNLHATLPSYNSK